MGAPPVSPSQVLPPQSSAAGRVAPVFAQPWRVPVETLQVWRPVDVQPTGERFYVLPRTDGQFALCDRRLPKFEQLRKCCASLAELKAEIAKLPPDDAAC